MKEMLIGSHLSMSTPDYLKGIVKEAVQNKETCFMFMIGPPQSTWRKYSTKEEANEFKKLCIENKIDLDNCVVHFPYIVNPATAKTEQIEFNIGFLKKEIIGTYQIGIKLAVLHPGSAVGIERDAAIKNCAHTINEINKTNPGVVICIETMSGKGNEIGITFEELKQIIDKVNNKKLVGVCFDTCHTWDYGYDLTDFDKILDEFDETIGLDYLKVLHINDSKNERGTHKDRHENIGYGKIGFKTICDICNNKRLENVPKLLETPVVDDYSSYGIEIKMIKSGKFKDWIK